MKTADEGRIICDEELAALERKISRMYGQAAAELQKTIDEYFNLFISKEMEMQLMLSLARANIQKWAGNLLAAGRIKTRQPEKQGYRADSTRSRIYDRR